MVLREFIYNFDFFAAVPSFRVKGEAEVLSICGGIVSMILIGFFLYVFLEDALKIVNFQKIQASQITKFSKQGTQTINDFVFAIGIQDHTLDLLQPILKIQALQQTHNEENNATFTDLPLVRCTKQIWQKVPDIDELFDIYNMNEMYCLQPSTERFLSGLQVDKSSQSIYISINLCQNQSSCLDILNILGYVENWVAENRYFTVNFFMLNTGFNLGQQNGSFFFLDDDTWITFNDQVGQQVSIKLGSYKMQTDISMLPWKVQNDQTGYYVAETDDSIIQPKRLNNVALADIKISMSRESKQFERDFGKLDETLGYVGGLFGIVFGFLAFFMMSYSQYRYELMVSEGAFSYEHGQRYKEEDFNVFTYIKYSIYDWIKFLSCCCQPQWENCQQIQQSRDEANEQLDIKYFMRRLANLQKMAKLRITYEEEMLESLSEPISIESVKKKRKVLQYYDTVMKGKLHITISGLKTAKNILNFMSDFNLENVDKGSSLIFNLNQGEQMTQRIQKESLEQIFEKHKTYLEQENEKIALTEEEEEIQKQLAQIFFRIESQHLQNMQNRIPILILYRLNKISNRTINYSEKVNGLANFVKVHGKQ